MEVNDEGEANGDGTRGDSGGGWNDEDGRGELRIDDERAHTRRGERTRGRIWGLQSEVQGVYICTCKDPWYWVRTSGTTDDKAMVE